MDRHLQIARQFGAQSWTRGQRYWREGRVIRLQWDKGASTWEARVMGNRREPYEVWVAIDEAHGRIEIDGDCDCPADKPCKHMAAVFCALLTTTAAPEPSAHERDLAIPRSRGHADDLARRRHALEVWAERSERIATGGDPPKRKPAAPRKYQLLYAITVEPPHSTTDPHPQVHVHTHRVALRKSGEFGEAQPIDLGAVLNRWRNQRPEWIDDADLARWFRLLSIVNREPSSWRLGGPSMRLPHRPAATAILVEIVGTGRCWFDHADQPMSMAPSRPGRLAWLVDRTGVQTLGVEPDDDGPPWTLLPLAPLHYVEHATGRCGLIDVDLPEAVGPLVTGMPPVDPEWTAELPAPVRKALVAAGLPLPRPLQVAPTRRVVPIPILHIGLRTDDGDLLPFASLSFDYDGARVDTEDESPRITVVEDDRVRRIVRDRVLEANARARLVALGLDGGPASSLLEPRNRGDWFDVCRVAKRDLVARGWRVEVEDGFEYDLATVDAWYADASDLPEEAGAAWFALELGVEIEGERVNVLPALVDAIRSGRITKDKIRLGEPVLLALDDGRRIAIEPARIEAMLDVLVELLDERLVGGRLRLRDLDLLRLSDLEGWIRRLSPKLDALASRLRGGGLGSIEPPPGLCATLREYQRHGLDWLQLLREAGLGGVLADDMGLGKTVQALAHLLVEKDAGRLDRPALVVAPRSVLRNWEREAQRFAPQLRVALYHGAGRAGLLATPGEVDLVVTTYALLQRDDALVTTPWHVAILDEAQAIKNPSTKVAVAARKLDARQRLCLTGTPMENHLGELWSIATFANPGLLGSPRQFADHYRRPIEKHGDAARFAALCRRLAPFMLRRTKTQVLTELPPKTEVVLHAELSGAQRDLYESVRMTMHERVRDELAARGLAKSQIIVLDALLKLRQVCCHPPLVKLERARTVERSAKLELLRELVAELVAEGRRALVFSQFTSMLEVIGRELDAMNLRWLSITGATQKRQEIVDRFQAGEVPVLLVSLKAGGTGLNLTAADTVIHYDPWWNPAVEQQATDRAHRIGQGQPVTVYRLICEGTVEERMLVLQERKAALTRGIHDAAERRSARGLALDADDIAALLSPLDADDERRSTAS